MDLGSLLTNLLSTNGIIRQDAEKLINNLCENSFDETLCKLSLELANTLASKNNRQLAGTLIRNLIMGNNQFQGKYLSINEQVKANIKQTITSCLAHNDSIIQTTAALVIATICKKELPLKLWPEIIPNLIENTTNENLNYRISSMNTLMYISQELENENVFRKEEIDMIFSNLISNINSGVNTLLSEAAFKCLISFIPFGRNNFSVKEERRIFFDLIYLHLKDKSENIRLLAMKFLVEIGKLFYDFLIDEIRTIYEYTIIYMEKDTKLVAIQGYEFWLTLSEEEIARSATYSDRKSYNFCRNSCVTFIDLLVRHIVNEPDPYFEEDESSLGKCSFNLLSYFAQLCDYSFIEKILVFINNNISSKEIKLREAAITILTSTFEYTNKDQAFNYVNDFLKKIIESLCENNTKLREKASWCLEKLCKEYSDYLIKNRKTFETILNTIIGIVDKSNNKSTVFLLCCIHYLATALKPNDFQTSTLMSYYMNNLLIILTNLMIKESSFDTSNNVSFSASCAIMSLIENSATDTKLILQGFFTEILNFFNKTLTNKNMFKSEEHRKNIQSYLANIIDTCFNSGKFAIDMEKGKIILEMIIESFKDRNNVYEEGLLAASSLGLSLKEQFFQIYLLLYPYVIYALNKSDDISLCKVGVTVTSDLIRSVGSNINLDEILPTTLKIINDNNIDKSLKIGALNIISDMFIECREKVIMYFDNIMKVVLYALEASLIILDEKESDLEEYFENLRETSLECISCIIQTLKDIKKTDLLINSVPSIMQFTNKINTLSYKPTTKIIKDSLGIISDFCAIYGKNMKPLLDTNILTNMHNELKKKSTKSKKIKLFLDFCEKSISSVF